VKHTLADTGKARKYLGYTPMVRLETGLAEQWKWCTS